MASRIAIVALVVALGAACSKKRIAECDSYIATMEKIARCKALPEGSGKTLLDTAKGMRQRLDDVDLEKARDEDVEWLRDICLRSKKTVVETYTEHLPECLK
jgi:hypothetical protein